MRHGLSALLAVSLVVSLPSPAPATPIGALERLSGIPKTYVLGEGLDFVIFGLSGLGDVTAPISNVDLMVPPDSVPNTATSGCEAADFAGFVGGNIALMQRGVCPFTVKVLNAANAGAVGALIFNEGQPGRTQPFDVSFNMVSSIPAAFVSFAVGEELAFPASLFGSVVHLSVTDNTPAQAVPEPASIMLLGLGLAAAARRRRKML